MGKLRSRKRERFCREIVFDGKDPRDAYIAAGFAQSGADFRNHNRLLRNLHITARIEELIRERDINARAARTSLSDVLAELNSLGIDRVADFFEGVPSDAGTVMVVRDLHMIRVEVALSLLSALHDGMGLPWDRELQAPNATRVSDLACSTGAVSEQVG